ncbi:MAG TPA: response regulator [Candidatus Deferrimicrobiaceae bacterium]|jgi:FixJ family two-component response regulator|nr:response regulator [Candidatus Deferrimicrobiaceae bacterium]
MNEVAPVVFVVDDDPIVCVSMQRLIRSLGLEVQTFISARDFLHATRPDAPGCLVLDVRLPDLSGLDLQQELAKANVDLPIIFVTGHADVLMSVRAMKAGAVEFLTKPFREQDLLEAIQHGIAQHRAARERRAVISELQQRLASLTPREQEVFSLVVSGLLNKQIADHLGASEKTIKIHRGQLMRKMQAESLADLVRMSEQLKIYSPKY